MGPSAEMGTAVGLIILALITSYSIILSLPTLLLSIAGLLYTTWESESSYLLDVSAIIIICFFIGVLLLSVISSSNICRRLQINNLGPMLAHLWLKNFKITQNYRDWVG